MENIRFARQKSLVENRLKACSSECMVDQRPIYTCCDFQCDLLRLTDVNERINNECVEFIVESQLSLREQFCYWFIIHIRQKEKIALEIAVKVALKSCLESVNGPSVFH
jgi:hypothetical protein